MTKCVNCRFRAKVDGKEVEGRIAVDGNYLRFFYDNGDIYSIHIPCYRKHGTDYFDDFEIVPRDPETYQDWQVGDIIWDSHESGDSGRIIFRSGDFVAADIDGCGCYTCEELFDDGYRLILTDIEQKIIDGKKKYEPQDGDICYAESKDDYRSIFVFRDGVFATDFYISYAKFEKDAWELNMSGGHAISDNNVAVLRPATEDEKQRLFDAMAKEGKRWNAEKKVVEDIPKPHEFKKGEPVLVKDEGGKWRIGVFIERENSFYGYRTRPADGIGEIGYRYCLPYNERTMHLLGTAEDYKEGE